MAKRSRLNVAILLAVVLVPIGLLAYGYLHVRLGFPGGRVGLVNGSGGAITRVSFTAASGDEKHSHEAPELAPGASWRAQFDGSPMPLIRLSWCQDGAEYVHEERTDLWAGDVWRVEILPGGRVRTGYWYDGWCADEVHEGVAIETTVPERR